LGAKESILNVPEISKGAAEKGKKTTRRIIKRGGLFLSFGADVQKKGS